MAIQIPNPGTGNALTGDNEFVLWSKVQSNFSNSSHAASREIGIDDNKVPLSSQIPSLAMRKYGDLMRTGDLNALSAGTVVSADASTTASTGQTVANMPSGERYCIVYTLAALVATHKTQIAISIFYEGAYKRTFDGTSWSPWSALSNNKFIYEQTTASGANVSVTSAGQLVRSTSSERYKDILADLELDDAAYANAMHLAPIVYRSTAEADNPDYHYYSFSAEKLGAFDPAFTLWRDTEVVTDAEGNTIEQPLAERVAEGININALLAFSHAIAIKQDKMIKVQAEAIETLTKRIDAMTAQ